MNTIEHRLMELEAKVAFQDETIEVLNDEIKVHQQLLAKMKRQTELLAEKIKESQSSSSMMSEAPEPPPPHY
ncbi:MULTISPECIES: SlyX family protein [Pseudoalteromonas]|jgi:SlyX protein|uniref:Protein SlyX homolog n=4 Tax=root TaxID=1 RepID=A0A063KM09_9GAMM|nr:MULTISPECIES: SlyX family protein [Pseudoalteromonas]ALQ09570.1 SlyX protein [Pseudoalteromonas sp. Bsw20308]ATC84917.1 SlyX protein [Pseudoalteromonas arctica A 37-1-2]KAA1157590.1 SlyX family protein [Pseudoalteromonas fuliginea]KAA1164461.1 SlyX family protein [Pseudoalteromonas fuliginea]KAA1167649.1 SlyX family protein [Pseudoalteromonas fuliginea]|tara:strand:+ start:360 stop:575 length:216 start_codon:yes stop_codon:yes gene_type:complete